MGHAIAGASVAAGVFDQVADHALQVQRRDPGTQPQFQGRFELSAQRRRVAAFAFVEFGQYRRDVVGRYCGRSGPGLRRWPGGHLPTRRSARSQAACGQAACAGRAKSPPASVPGLPRPAAGLWPSGRPRRSGRGAPAAPARAGPPAFRRATGLAPPGPAAPGAGSRSPPRPPPRQGNAAPPWRQVGRAHV
ncbi:hypothetical protein G6F65_019744 [Rhizopus arrhizus]|nr:hypothetical protein G6F65_019744 [Rhizopus arrhizus]